MTAKEAINCFKHPTQHFTTEREEADKLAVQALEKQVPKTPIETDHEFVFRCATCNAIVIQNLSTKKIDYCTRCGQAIDWN